MRKRTGTLLTALLGFGMAVQGTAFAGQKGYAPVYIDSTSFHGSIGSARNSADSVQYLSVVDGGTFIVIQAKDASGTSVQCVTHDSTHFASLRGMSDSSALSVYYDATGTCTSMNVTTSSLHEPKVQ